MNPNQNKPFLEHTEKDQQAMTVKTPGQCFQLFSSDAVIEFTIFQTKWYRKQNFDIDNTWQDISVAKMKAFFGIVLAMDLVTFQKFHDYWAFISIKSVQWFSNIMPRRIFFKAFACLHLSDDATQPEREHPDMNSINVHNCQAIWEICFQCDTIQKSIFPSTSKWSELTVQFLSYRTWRRNKLNLA